MTEAYYKIDLRSQGGSITLSPDSPLRLLAGGLRGFDSTDFDVVTGPYANANGGYIKRRRFAEREMELTFEITENDRMWRRQLLSVVQPTADCELRVTVGENTRRINTVPAGRVTFRRDSFYDRTTVTLRFIAPDPFFMADEARTGAFVRKIPLLTFPMSFYPSGSLTAGYTVHAYTGNAFNEGDVACGVVITIRAQGGAVTNPAVYCGNRAIETNVLLQVGDTMVIDTRPHRKGIRINGESRAVFKWKSDFFALAVGDNQLLADAATGMENMAVRYEYVPLYLGV